jgi:ubiquinone/menaquinone biosynthesis C-methylase UbiE
MSKDLILNVYKDFSARQKNTVELKFLSKFSKSKVFVSKITGTVFHADVIKNKDNLNSWNKIYSKKIEPKNLQYTSNNPIMNSRHFYGVKLIEQFLKKKKLLNKKINFCDFGTGEANFPFLLKKQLKNINIILTEYSKSNFNFFQRKFAKEKITIKNSFLGSIEDFDQLKNNKTIDFASLIWTLCNCSNPIKVLQSINNSLVDKGFLIVAESSRILVPFKKPIYNYFNSSHKSSYHPWHFSYNSLQNLLEICNFKVVFANRYYDENDLFIICQKQDIKKHMPRIVVDDYKKIIKFFRRWQIESNFYKSL